LIGTWIGILPGIGANIGSVMAYTAAKHFSSDPDKFGEGSEEGIIASEAANNATVGGALIPLVALGIPGSVIDAILLGALVIHGLQPGPLLFSSNPDVVYTIMVTFLLANLTMFLFMTSGCRFLAKLVRIPRAYLLPVILVFCVVGSYALANRIFDVWVMLAFGLLGFGLEQLRVPLAPFVIGFVLAPVAESNLGKGLVSTGGNWWPVLGLSWPQGASYPVLDSGITLTFFAISVGMLIWPLVRRSRKRSFPMSDFSDG
jgi:putative tricarboxylic transport membrane protein